MRMLTKRPPGIAFRATFAVILPLGLFGLLICVIGSLFFTDTYKKHYSETTYHMAYAATTLLYGDHIDDYLKGERKEEYEQCREDLYDNCQKINAAIIYVIKVDVSDYESFVSVFDIIDNEVSNTDYTEWELGSRRKAHTKEYSENYRLLYEKKIDYATIYREHKTDGTISYFTTMVPVENEAGDVTAILCVQRPMRELIQMRKHFLINIFVFTFIISVLTAMFAAFYIKHRLTAPIKKVADEAVRFAEENTKREPLGRISNYLELQNLAESIDKMESDMTDYMGKLMVATAERERINTELSVAAKIQGNAVPNVFPAFPDRADVDIYASMTPAKEIGGDFYNFFFIDEDHLAMIIGDVSGKGIPAALFMMVTNILISDRVKMGGSPAEILAWVNNSICDNNQAHMFVTLWLGVLELSTGIVTAANAGHLDPAICRQNRGFELYKTKHGLVVGAIGGITYTDYEIRLFPGDKLFLYTDGLPEATNCNERELTLDGMLEVLHTCGKESPKGIVSAVHAGVERFMDGNYQFDDLTMLCVEYRGAKLWQTFTIKADIEQVPCVTEILDKFVTGYNCPIKLRQQLELALEEAFVNIARYAYPDTEGDVQISLSATAREMIIILEDGGIPFNPLEREAPDITAPGEKRKVGGLGILMIKKNVDTLDYRYENNRNILTIKKRM